MRSSRWWDEASEAARVAFLDSLPVEWLNASLIRRRSRAMQKRPVQER